MVNLITYNTSNVTSFTGAFTYSAGVVNQSVGYDAFGPALLLIMFLGFYVVGSRYSQERALTFALFMSLVGGFIMTSGAFLDPIWLIITAVCLMASVFISNRVN